MYIECWLFVNSTFRKKIDETCVKILKFPFKEMFLNLSSAKYQQFGSVLNMFNTMIYPNYQKGVVTKIKETIVDNRTDIDKMDSWEHHVMETPSE